MADATNELRDSKGNMLRGGDHGTLTTGKDNARKHDRSQHVLGARNTLQRQALTIISFQVSRYTKPAG